MGSAGDGDRMMGSAGEAAEYIIFPMDKVEEAAGCGVPMTDEAEKAA